MNLARTRLVPGFIPVYIGGERHDASYELWADGYRGPFLGRCHGYCSAWIPPGRYNLVVDGPGLVTASRYVDLSTASELRVTPRTVAAHNAGIVMALVGFGLAVVGLGFALEDSPFFPRNAEGREPDRLRSGLGLLGLASGAVLIPVGFALARTSPAVEVRPLYARVR